uniref:Uncharacterized protein AlNc14C33G3020 n=1 Tax=Albugo laibachii Nc14 TaxID=890382 RepID=F0W843_9STRA|nr:conserved hypothetical protein [Albugo laibachii Nc14]|eukprot:CCA17326.1 conserved hypothetical protein [Albugo laibachii Nc14]
MGGGGLQILGHKRWHVWRRDNIERVTKDEEKKNESILEKERKERLFEQEQRYELQQQKVENQTQVKPFSLFYKEEQSITKKNEEIVRKGNTLASQKFSPWYTLPKGVEPPSKTRKRGSEIDPLLSMRPRNYQKRYRDAVSELKDVSTTSLGLNEKKKKSNNFTLEKLRQEREEREANERQRTRRLIGN